MSDLVQKLIPHFESLKKRFPKGFDSSLTLPALRKVQEERGFVADEDIDALVQYLGVPRMQIEQVLSFYTQFRRDPIGRHHIEVCRNVSCSMRGSESVLNQLTRRLGIEPGQTTPDGRVTLTTCECLGSCGTAPVVMVNEAYHENMTPARLDALLESLK
jgi:NADH-quinone oxidoreductase subunit E